MLAGTCPPYATALVDRVPEPKSVAALVFCQSVVALRSGVRIPGQNARFNGRPPGLDGGGQTVHLGCVGRGGLLVETVQVGPDDMALGVRAGETKQAAKLLLSVNRPWRTRHATAAVIPQWASWWRDSRAGEREGIP